MLSGSNMKDAALYTDFGGLARLRAQVSSSSAEAGSGSNVDKLGAGREVAKQFEALFIQLMLKTMRDASQLNASTDSDQTRLYQDMFDKQIALDMATRGRGIGLAAMLERDLGLDSNVQQQDLLQQQFALAAKPPDQEEQV